MLVTEIFDFNRGEEKDRYPFHKPDPSTSWAIFDRSGKALRSGLTQAAANALSQRPDLIKKYGRLRVGKV